MVEVREQKDGHGLVFLLLIQTELTTELKISWFLSASDQALITFIMGKGRVG